MKARLGVLALFAVLVACGIKGAPRPSRKPPPKADPPAAVTPLPAREPTSGGLQDGGAVPVESADAGTPDAGILPSDAGVSAAAAPAAADGGTDAGR